MFYSNSIILCESCFYSEEPSLLVSEQYELINLGLRSFHVQALITPGRKTIFSLDYDQREQRVYWVSLEEERIKYAFHSERNNIGTIVKGKGYVPRIRVAVLYCEYSYSGRSLLGMTTNVFSKGVLRRICSVKCP